MPCWWNALVDETILSMKCPGRWNALVDEIVIDKMVVYKTVVDEMVVDKMVVDEMVVDKIIVDKMLADKMVVGNCPCLTITLVVLKITGGKNSGLTAFVLGALTKSKPNCS